MSFKADVRGARKFAGHVRNMATRLEKAESLAASDLQRRIAPEFVRDAQTTHNISPKRVRESTAVRRNGSVVELQGLHRPTGLLQFGAKASAPGVVATVLKSVSPFRLRHAFIAAGVNGNRQVFQREAYGKGAYRRVMTKGNYKGQLRTPLKAIYGPSVAQILRDPERQTRLNEFAMKRVSVEIRRQLGRL